MEKKVSTKMDPSVPPNFDKNITEERALVAVREAIWCIGASHSASLFFIIKVESFCCAHTIT